MRQANVLVIDDDPPILAAVQAWLEEANCEVVTAGSTGAAIRRLADEPFHAVLCDLNIEGGGGLEVLRAAQERSPQPPVIVITGDTDAQIARECFAVGAFDYLAKPLEKLALFAMLRRALRRRGLRVEGKAPAGPASGLAANRFPALIGTSQAMQTVQAQITKVAEAEANVCVYGESGTGKELVARAIHSLSRRAKGPFIVFDCAAVPEGLMESEMFGHVKGSFTSAVSHRDGVFQLADTGTLLLDEVGELSLPLQAKLLRVIQCREFRQVGGSHPVKVDVRILAATNKHLAAMVAAGSFREDLYYRLAVIPLVLPPLRERKEDIPLLADHFVQKFNRKNRKQVRGISPTTMGVLLRYHWPGNVRELENCVERAAVMADRDIIDTGDLAQAIRPIGVAAAVWPQSLREAERDLILKTLEGMQGNRTQTAALLGISLRGLQCKLKELQSAGVDLS